MSASSGSGSHAARMRDGCAAALAATDVLATGAVRDGVLVYASPALARTLGIAGNASPRSFSEFVAEGDRDRVAQALASRRAISLAFRGVRADASLFEASLCAGPADLADGFAMAIALHDASRGEAETKPLSYAALYDPGSGLPNRRFYVDRVEQAVIAAGRSGRKVTAMVIEIAARDETAGGAINPERCLKAACARLQSCLRETDTIARLDETSLGVLLPRLGAREQAAAAAARMAASVATPLEVEGRRVRVELRFGIAAYPDDAPTPERLVERAEAALRDSAPESGEPIAFATPHALVAPAPPARVQWSERYEVGIEVIDGQHRQLLELINRLGDDLSAGRDFDQLVESLKALVRYTEHHFATEERLMDEVGAGAERHRAEHRRLEESLARLTLPLDAAGVRQSSRFLQDWLFLHIDEVDRPFAAFLRAQGIG